MECDVAVEIRNNAIGIGIRDCRHSCNSCTYARRAAYRCSGKVDDVHVLLGAIGSTTIYTHHVFQRMLR